MHGLVRIRTVQVEHSGTRVEQTALRQTVRRTNDTNANGDRPIRVNIRRPERHTQTAGGLRPTDPTTATETNRTK